MNVRIEFEAPDQFQSTLQIWQLLRKVEFLGMRCDMKSYPYQFICKKKNGQNQFLLVYEMGLYVEDKKKSCEYDNDPLNFERS